MQITLENTNFVSNNDTNQNGGELIKKNGLCIDSMTTIETTTKTAHLELSVNNNHNINDVNCKLLNETNLSQTFESPSCSDFNFDLPNNNDYLYDEKSMNKEQQSNSSVALRRVLQKTMTKGTKAMRTLGNNVSPNAAAKFFSFRKNATTLTRSMTTKKLTNKRLLFKNGTINVSRSNIDKRRRRYLTDIFTTLIDLKWRYNIMFFAMGFFVSWTGFAVLWYGIAFIHDDLMPDNLNNPLYKPCILNVSSFAGAILFSIETQQTIGYGVRVTTEKCSEAILVMMLQSSIGVMIQSFMVGVVFAKLSRPKKRSETLMFSKSAVITLRDGRLCLMCRVADMRKSHIVEAHVRMYLIKKNVTLEGEIIPLHMHDLNVGWDKGLDRLFLIWPLTIEHYIDSSSPFWNLSPQDLKNERFEIAVILEGVVESTGMTTQARTSYLPDEILWGHRFDKLVTFEKEDGTYKIDYSRFNSVIPVDAPTCSAKQLAEFKEQEQVFIQQQQASTDNEAKMQQDKINSKIRKRNQQQRQNNQQKNLYEKIETETPTILLENFDSNDDSEHNEIDNDYDENTKMFIDKEKQGLSMV